MTWRWSSMQTGSWTCDATMRPPLMKSQRYSLATMMEFPKSAALQLNPEEVFSATFERLTRSAIQCLILFSSTTVHMVAGIPCARKKTNMAMNKEESHNVSGTHIYCQHAIPSVQYIAEESSCSSTSLTLG